MTTGTIAQDLLTSQDGTTPAARQQYDKYGILVVPQLIPKDDVDMLREVFTSYAEGDNTTMKDFPKGGPANDILQKYPRLMHPHRHPTSKPGEHTLQLMTSNRLLDVVKNLIGPANGAQSMFYFKPPTARGQALHQDNWFLRAHPETCLAVWIAVDDADSENGGLHLVPGSHRNDILCHGQSDLSQSFSPNMIKLPPGIDAWNMSLVTKLKAGDVMFFHGSIVHGSLPNKSERFRRCLIYHYCPQSSTEIAVHYQPLIAPSGEKVYINQSDLGGPCGDVWTFDENNGRPASTMVM